MGWSFLYHHYRSTQTSGAIDGEKLRNVGSDRVTKMVSLYSMYILCLIS